MNQTFLRWISRAFFLQELCAKAIGMVPPIIQKNFGKYDSLKKAFYLTSHDAVEGDYLEFGVYTGASMAAAIHLSRKPFLPAKYRMRYFGFDSFQGFGKLVEQEQWHPCYKDSNFQTDAGMVGRRLTRLLDDPQRLKLVAGFYEETLQGRPVSDYGIEKAAVILVDCDTFSAATHVFGFIEPALQEGTILIMDDFFMFKGNPQIGVCGAFRQFEREHPVWKPRLIWNYGCGGVAYILTKSH